MASTLNTHVHVHHPEHGSAVFGPGDTVPAWARKQITRDDVWDDGDTPAPAADDEEPEPDTGEGDEGPTEPPRTGAGSGVEAWRDFADQVDGFEVDEDATRDDIVAAWDAHLEGDSDS